MASSLARELTPESAYAPVELLPEPKRPQDDRRKFVGLIAGGMVLSWFAAPYPIVAMWLGFLFAAYSAVANDSIQTLGAFLAANQKRPWWLLWIFVGGVFLATMSYSWFTYDGDVSYQRLASKGFAEAPTEFTFLQVAAPLVLLVLTRLRMPVSTTFLLLSAFSTSAKGIGSVLSKSLSGYLLAFVIAIAAWAALSRVVKRFAHSDPHPAWNGALWVSTGALWAVWLMQDAANIAVYLPRSLSIGQFVAFAGSITVALGLLMYLRGGKIQSIVTEKSDVFDVRSAAIVNLVFAVILYIFKIESKVPMSTTWVFIGLLAGREVAMILTGTSSTRMKDASRMIAKDMGLATAGLLVSLLMAFGINDAFREQVLNFIRG